MGAYWNNYGYLLIETHSKGEGGALIPKGGAYWKRDVKLVIDGSITGGAYKRMLISGSIWYKMSEERQVLSFNF